MKTASRVGVAVVSYEFTFSPFSGNGVLARSLVKGLLAAGCRIVVVCAQPDDSHASSDHPITVPEVDAAQEASLLVLPVKLAADAGWRRLDARAAHEYFAAGAAKLADRILGEMGEASLAAAIAIDWTGGGACVAMQRASAQLARLPMCYINFRVYSSGLTDTADPPATWFDQKEAYGRKDPNHQAS